MLSVIKQNIPFAAKLVLFCTVFWVFIKVFGYDANSFAVGGAVGIATMIVGDFIEGLLE